MVTSSMHKPGWRSRRRSRLSLVERAVPKLGHLPPAETSLKPPRGDGSSKPCQPHPPSTDAADGTPSTEQAGAEPSTTMDQDAAPDPSGDAGQSPADLETADAPPADDQGRPISTADGSGSFGHDAATPSFEGTIPDNDPAEASAPPADSGVAQAAADAPAASPSEPPAHAAFTPIAIDWDRLVEQGFTDPRQTGQPLPKTMGEIVRALIRQSLSDQSSWRDRIILVTSPNERDSKTVAAMNFAFGMATVARHHVVLVDVDTTGPGVIERVGGDGTEGGIAKALADEHMAIDDVVLRTDLERLTLVASGVSDEDTLDRFASRRMLQILRHLTENPDTLLIIDAPPILASQEAAVLSVIAGQVVLTVEAGRTTAGAIDHALQRIGDRHNVSLVLNESSGVRREASSALATTSANRWDTANDENDQAGRRQPKIAAAIAFFVVTGLLVMQAYAGADRESAGTFAQSHVAERWSSQHGMPVVEPQKAQW